MQGNKGQVGNNFVGMKVRVGKKFYIVVDQIIGAPYEKHFKLKGIEDGKEIYCSRNKFTIPRK